MASLSLHAEQSYTAIFEQANSLYKQEKYQDALSNYKRIPERGAIVNYNMGNCAYKLKNYGLALLFWRRAESDWGFFGGSELLNNIKHLKSLLQQRMYELQTKPTDPQKTELFLQKIKSLKIIADFYIRSIPLAFFQVVFLLLWAIAFIFIGNMLRRKRKMLVMLLFTLIAIFGLILVSKYAFEIKQHGVVVSTEAKLLSGPGQNYQILSFVPEATEINIEKESDGFYKVKINGQIGWMSQSSIEKF
jgi:tetratricopeptide (TPR) repeat protein